MFYSLIFCTCFGASYSSYWPILPHPQASVVLAPYPFPLYSSVNLADGTKNDIRPSNLETFDKTPEKSIEECDNGSYKQDNSGDYIIDHSGDYVPDNSGNYNPDVNGLDEFTQSQNLIPDVDKTVVNIFTGNTIIPKQTEVLVPPLESVEDSDDGKYKPDSSGDYIPDNSGDYTPDNSGDYNPDANGSDESREKIDKTALSIYTGNPILPKPIYSFGFRLIDQSRDESANLMGRVIGSYSFTNLAGNHDLRYEAGPGIGFIPISGSLSRPNGLLPDIK